MTKKQAAQRALDKWIEILRLGHWDIDLVLEDAKFVNVNAGNPDYGAVGTVDRHFPSLVATVFVAGQISAKEIAGTVKHELLHVVATPLVSLAYELAETPGTEAQAAAKFRIGIAEEHIVRTLERAFDRLEDEG